MGCVLSIEIVVLATSAAILLVQSIPTTLQSQEPHVDFNGDGHSDILWQNTDGQAAIWEMNGTNVIGSELVGPNPGPSWKAIGTGDFNDDGHSDILWQNANGQTAILEMDGTHVFDAAAVAPTLGRVGSRLRRRDAVSKRRIVGSDCPNRQARRKPSLCLPQITQSPHSSRRRAASRQPNALTGSSNTGAEQRPDRFPTASSIALATRASARRRPIPATRAYALSQPSHDRVARPSPVTRFFQPFLHALNGPLARPSRASGKGFPPRRLLRHCARLKLSRRIARTVRTLAGLAGDALGGGLSTSRAMSSSRPEICSKGSHR